MVLNIQLPDVLKPAKGLSGRAALEHAALDCRACETLLALALGRRPGSNVVFVTPFPDRARLALAKWLGLRPTAMAAGQLFVVNGVSLLLVRDEKSLGGVHFPTVDALYAADSHRLKANPADALGQSLVGDALLAGQIADRGHWFYDYCRSASETMRVPASDIVGQFPDQRSRVLELTDPSYPRLMELEDVEPPVRPFRVFARKRLKVRTDKRPEALSERQLEAAKAQFGEFKVGWAPVVPFDLLPMQRRYLAMKRMAASKGFSKVLLLKYRRGGFTTLEQGISYSSCVQRGMTYCATLAHKLESTQRIFRMASFFCEKDPDSPRMVGDSKTALEFANGSYFFIGTAGARGFSRGDTLQRVHGSEVPYWLEGPNHMRDMEVLVAGIMEAASNGEVVFEGTPNGREWFYHTYTDAKKGINDWWPAFLPWWLDPLNSAAPGTFDPEEVADTLTDEERLLVGQNDLTLAQVAFRRQKKRSLKRLFVQEYPEDDETCFLTSGTCFFDVDAVLALLGRVGEPQRRHLAGGFEARVEEPQPGVEYVAGCDTSEGLPGCDPNGVGVFRKDNGRQVAWIHGLFKPALLAEHAARLCHDYNDALLGIERENHGHAVIQKIIELGYGRPHYRGGSLYYFTKLSDQDKKDANKKLARAGWSTNAVTRPVMLEELADAIEEGSIVVEDRDFLGECLSFRLQGNGRFEADSGSHDDSVMKWAIAWQMRKHRKHKPSIATVEGGVFG